MKTETVAAFFRWRIRGILGLLAPLVRKRTTGYPSQRVLCIVGGGLGDSLMALPLLRSVQRQSETLVLGVIWLSTHGELYSKEFPNALQGGPKNYLRSALFALKKWDEVIVSMMGFYSVRAEVLTFLSRAPRAIGPLAPQGTRGRSVYSSTYPLCHGLHYTCVNMQALPEHSSSKALSYPLASDHAAMDKKAIPIRVIMHFGSNSKYALKRWPHQNILAFLRMIRARHRYSYSILMGPDDSELLHTLARHQTHFLLTESLTDLATALSGADIFIGVDSGPAHLAAALGLKGIVLFGPTDPSECAPLFVEREIITSNLECLGCFSCSSPCKNDFQCMRSISPEMVYDKLASLSHGI